MFLAECDYQRLPASKFKELKGRKKGDKYKDYEFKEDVYRIYLFDDPDLGKIIAICSTKDSQDRDIARLRKIKSEYFKQKK